MSQVFGSNNSYKPITNTGWVRVRLCKLQKGSTRLAAASDKVYQLLAHDRWFSPCTPASSTTKTGRHDIAEILLKVALKHQKSIKSFYTLMNKLEHHEHFRSPQYYDGVRFALHFSCLCFCVSFGLSCFTCVQCCQCFWIVHS